MIMPETLMPSGSVVELKLPTSGEVSFSAASFTNSPLCEIQGLSTPEVIPCKVDKVIEEGVERQVISWTTTEEIEASSAIQLQALDCFTNPLTTEPTRTFEMRTYPTASKASVLDIQTVDLQLQASFEELNPEHAFLATAEGGTGEVSKATKVVLNLEPTVTLPPNCIITIDLPKFNPEAPRSLRKSYAVAENDIITCEGLKNADGALKCTFEALNTQTDRITISDFLPNGMPKGEKI